MSLEQKSKAELLAEANIPSMPKSFTALIEEARGWELLAERIAFNHGRKYLCWHIDAVGYGDYGMLMPLARRTLDAMMERLRPELDGREDDGGSSPFPFAFDDSAEFECSTRALLCLLFAEVCRDEAQSFRSFPKKKKRVAGKRGGRGNA